jgi:hypothetical protein
MSPSAIGRLVLVTGMLAGCAPARPEVLPLPPAVAEREVRAALARFFDAASTMRWSVIDSLLAPDFLFYSDSALVLSRSEFLDAMRQDSMTVQELDLRDVDVSLSEDAHFAIVRYRLSMRASMNGEPYNMLSAETVGFRRTASRWVMMHNHASIRRAG